MKVFLIILALGAFCSGQENCLCENGHCEEENGKIKCVCDPEYGLYVKYFCKACKCGKGANCTFDRGFFSDTTICICPEGYSNVDEKCVEIHPPSTVIFRTQSTLQDESATLPTSVTFEELSTPSKNCLCENGHCEEENGKIKCVCNPEYGLFTNNYCKACKCGKGANCTFERGIFSDSTICICPEGYSNVDEKCVDESATLPTSVTFEELSTPSTICEPNPCQNGGRCVSGGEKFYCLCPKDYFGMLCESKIPDASTVLPSSVTFEEQSTLSTICEPNPCQNGGHCFSRYQKFYCLCPEDYFGMLCELSKTRESETFRPQTSPFSRFTESLPSTRTVSRFTSSKEFSQTSWYRTSTPFPTTSGCRCLNGYCIPDIYGNWKCVCRPDYGLYGNRICIPCHCGPDTSCKFERIGSWLKKHCICPRGFQDRNGTCVELCNPRTCIHGQCEISDSNNVCRCDDGYKGIHCNEKIEKIMDDKIIEILEIQAPWILLTVLLLIILVAAIVINRNKNIKKNSFFFLNSDEKCPLFEDSKFLNRLQTEVLE